MKKLIFVLILAISTSLVAKKQTTKNVMHDAYYSLSQLLPFLASELEFSEEKNHKKINEHINRLSMAFKSGEHQEMLKAPTFKPSVEAIINNLDAAGVSFAAGNKSFARIRLNSTTALCISCHTQLPKNQLTTMLVNNKDLTKSLKDNTFELANTYFILRDYDKALKYYQKYITTFEKKNNRKSIDSVFEYYNKNLYAAYFNSIYITAKALRDPSKSIAIIKRFQKQPTPQYIKEELMLWHSRANFWNKKYPKLNANKLVKSDIDKMIKIVEKKIIIENDTILSGDYDYDLMLLSGVLAQYSVQNTKTKKGTTLYWMGLAEYRLGKTLFFNLGDEYLKRCINNNPKTNIAKRCFNALEADIEFRNTGSQGSSIPKNVLNEASGIEEETKVNNLSFFEILSILVNLFLSNFSFTSSRNQYFYP